MISSNGKSQEGAWLWLLKIVAGLVIILVLGIHFWVNHLLAPNGLLNYTDVLAYYQNPIIPAMEIVFLVFVVAHALLGIRSILLDLNPSWQVLRWINVLLLIIGVAAIAYGTWLVLFIAAKGA
ncbi:succinate dehydrogenase, hydrophobic anchor subunit [Longilinea arvoryzae]|uniref:Succinate dehydrogenase, hydrophobic anchor subunit n=1 Tax=Longilinea arvoryzae TaxID=360412 RepID=A0A0S7BAU9_9CHLR|nr:hypothetical protein [Longilinea arvoryzae]GAP14654.1 succinate dehydrogenase, hydrophobic anchor subunit [Longilinea arvoryzae]